MNQKISEEQDRLRQCNSEATHGGGDSRHLERLELFRHLGGERLQVSTRVLLVAHPAAQSHPVSNHHAIKAGQKCTWFTPPPPIVCSQIYNPFSMNLILFTTRVPHQ